MSERTTSQRILISTVTPVYGGAKYLPELLRRLADLRASWTADSQPFELVESIFVDDDSVDDSGEVLEELRRQYPFLRITTLSRNYGQHPATVAGILHSSGDWVVTLDEDLQHPPEAIPALLRSAIENSLDVVYAGPSADVHGSWYRDWSSRSYKRFLSLVTGYPHLRFINSFRIVRGSVARAAAAISSHDAYLDVVLGWFTERFGTVPLELRDERRATSGYTLLKLLSHARRALVTSQTKWLRLGAAVGFLAMLFSTVVGVGIFVEKALDPSSIDVRGWTSLFLAIVFFGGLCSFLLGVALEYLSSLVLQAQGKPPFFVVDRSGDELLREDLAPCRGQDAASQDR